MDNLREMFFQGLVSGPELIKERNARRKTDIIQSVPLSQLAEYEKNGWLQHKSYKTVAKIKKPKPIDMLFEDQVWCMLADMGFEYMNSGRLFKLPYSEDYSLTQQVDAIAIDNETILIVECKAAESLTKNRSFKETIEAIGGKKEGILSTLRRIFPGAKHKVKFIFATYKYVLPKPDMDRLTNFKIALFEEEEIEYYQELTGHLGSAAKYQLLGNLFQGQTIPGIDGKIPAIMRIPLKSAMCPPKSATL